MSKHVHDEPDLAKARRNQRSPRVKIDANVVPMKSRSPAGRMVNAGLRPSETGEPGDKPAPSAIYSHILGANSRTDNDVDDLR